MTVAECLVERRPQDCPHAVDGCPSRPPMFECRREPADNSAAPRSGSDQCRLLRKRIAPLVNCRVVSSDSRILPSWQDLLGGTPAGLASGRLVDLKPCHVIGDRIGNGQNAERPILASTMALPHLLAGLLEREDGAAIAGLIIVCHGDRRSAGTSHCRRSCG